MLETTFRDETETDLFGEQAVLCGGTSALIRADFDILVRAGDPSELAYFECLHELKFIVDLIREAGIAGMRRLISGYRQMGRVDGWPKTYRSIGAATHALSAAGHPLRQIRARFIREMKTDRAGYAQLLRKAEKHPIEKVGARLRRMMTWCAKI